MTNGKKMIGYGCFAIVAAPIVVPIAFLGYVSMKATRFAFRHAVPVAFVLGIGGLLTYEGCHHRGAMLQATSAFMHHFSAPKSATLEESIMKAPVPAFAPDPTTSLTPTPPPGAIAMIDEPGFSYAYVRNGETLSSIAQRVTGSPEHYRDIARASRIGDPDTVAIGTLLRIPDTLRRGTPEGLYNRVPCLSNVTLPGSITLQEMFGQHTQEIINVNRALGLSYSDEFPYPKGERVVWFPDAAR